MNVEDIASQSRVIFETVYSMTEKTQFLGSMFPHVVQSHMLGELYSPVGNLGERAKKSGIPS